jgi:hypothetical protein
MMTRLAAVTLAFFVVAAPTLAQQQPPQSPERPPQAKDDAEQKIAEDPRRPRHRR